MHPHKLKKMENYVIAAAASLAIMVLAIMSIALSYGRFAQGEFKTVLGWILIALYILIIPYAWVVALLLVRAAWNLYKFSKVFGFKDLRGKFGGKSQGKTK
ncbi:MAG: hypothetical protein A7315_15215 [Candidatus Altiarchaeales archaeon WOR_SM1_79]|nr:MAG: hypothetical protein A7315_15215 [Candidatus Altiarchaeales archaeon WOR_SM1_79]